MDMKFQTTQYRSYLPKHRQARICNISKALRFAGNEIVSAKRLVIRAIGRVRTNLTISGGEYRCDIIHKGGWQAHVLRIASSEVAQEASN